MDILSFLKDRHGIDLNAQQRQAVVTSCRNTLLLAVPGSGKTTVLTARVAHLMENGVPADRILIITFNREAAGHMRGRFQTLFGQRLQDTPHFSTIHSFCLEILRQYAKSYRRTLPKLLSDAAGQRLRILRELYKKYNSEHMNEDQLDTLEKAIGYVKNRMLSDQTSNSATGTTRSSFHPPVDSFWEIFAEYERVKKQNRLMDFDDMLTHAFTILNRFPNILTLFQKQYSHICLDEAQDTSLIQYKILEKIAHGNTLFMVGDEDQSIYAFRGAHPQTLLNFSEQHEDAAVIKMEENFRSVSEIVRPANQFIQQNRFRYAKEMFCRNPKKGSVQVIDIEDYADQYRKTFELITANPVNQTLCVLYRNNESALPLIDLFYLHNKEFFIKEHKNVFFTSGVLRDILAYLRLALDPLDFAAFSEIYFKLGYSRGVFEYVRDHIRHNSLFETVLEVNALSDFMRHKTREYSKGFARLSGKSPESAVSFIQEELNYDSYHQSRNPDGFAKTGVLQKLNTVKALAAGISDLPGFLHKIEQLEYAIGKGEQVSRNANVTLSTMHSGKGLEFDTVILLDTIKDILPSENAVNEKLLGDAGEYENEARLFYVAVTRAKEQLIFFRSDLLNGEQASPSKFQTDFLEHMEKETKE